MELEVKFFNTYYIFYSKSDLNKAKVLSETCIDRWEFEDKLKESNIEFNYALV